MAAALADGRIATWCRRQLDERLASHIGQGATFDADIVRKRLGMYVRLRNVKRAKAKGRIYYYHRPTMTRLPDDPRAGQFQVRLAELNAQTERLPAAAVRGVSLGAVVVRFREASEFRELADKTRRDYIRYLDFLTEHFGDIQAATISRGFLAELRDQFQGTPRKANYLITVLRRTLKVADEHDWVDQCPALQHRTKRLKAGPGYTPRPDAAILTASGKVRLAS